MQKIDAGKFRITRRKGMAKGTVLLAALLFLFLSATGAYADQVCSDCHDTSQHNRCDAGNCAACHGNPPVDAGGLIHPYAAQTTPVASGSASAGAHAKHATPAGANYPCSTCHYSGMSVSSGQLIGGTNNGNGTLQMGFSIPVAGDTLSGGSYDGVPGMAYPYEGTNSTVVTLDGSKTCSTIYCHSDGTFIATGVIQGSPSAPWNAAGPLPCNACHGYSPSYAQDQPKSNSHSWHTGFGCNVCHYATTTDGTTLTDLTRHANAVYDVVPDPNFMFYGNPITFSYQYNPGGGRCSSLSCHGSKYWGGVQYSTVIRPNYGPECYQVNFQADASGGTAPYTYSWDFGDGQTGQGESLTHYYATPDPYTVTLNALDAKNHPADQSQLQITPQPNANTSPVVSVGMNISDYTVTLTDLSYDPDFNTCGRSGPARIVVYWGDGTAPTVRYVDLTSDVNGSGQVFTHTYTRASTFVIYYDVYDNSGSKVRVDPNPVATVPQKYTMTVNTSSPLPGVYVYLKQNGMTKQIKTTDSLGSATFTNVGAGTYQVQAAKSGYSFDGDQNTAGNQNPITVILGPNKTVTFNHVP